MEFLKHAEPLLKDMVNKSAAFLSKCEKSDNLYAVKSLNDFYTQCESSILQVRQLRQECSKLAQKGGAESAAAVMHLLHNSVCLIAPFLIGLNLHLPHVLISLSLDGINIILQHGASDPRYTQLICSKLIHVGIGYPADLQPPDLPPVQPNSKSGVFGLQSKPDVGAVPPETLQLKTLQTSLLVLHTLPPKFLNKDIVASIIYLSGAMTLDEGAYTGMKKSFSLFLSSGPASSGAGAGLLPTPPSATKATAPGLSLPAGVVGAKASSSIAARFKVVKSGVSSLSPPNSPNPLAFIASVEKRFNPLAASRNAGSDAGGCGPGHGLSSVVNSAASATLRQIVALVFEKIQRHVESQATQASSGHEQYTVLLAGEIVFKRLCLLGEYGTPTSGEAAGLAGSEGDFEETGEEDLDEDDGGSGSGGTNPQTGGGDVAPPIHMVKRIVVDKLELVPPQPKVTMSHAFMTLSAHDMSPSGVSTNDGGGSSGSVNARSLSFELLDTILQTTPTLFDIRCEPAEEEESSFPSVAPYTSLLRYKVCPLVTTTLLSEHHHDDVATHQMSSNSSSKSSSQPTVIYTGTDFPLLVKLLKLSQTILLKFGCRLIGGECHILLTTLLHFVSTATETYKRGERMVGIGSNSKERGGSAVPFYFSDDERVAYFRRFESQEDEGGAPGDGSRDAKSAKESGARDNERNAGSSDRDDGSASTNLERGSSGSSSSSSTSVGGGVSIPRLALWRATLSLEICHSIASNPTLISELHNSYDESRPNATIIQTLGSVVTDFIMASSVERGGVMRTVETAYKSASVRRGSGTLSLAGNAAKNDYRPQLFQIASTINKQGQLGGGGLSSHSKQESRNNDCPVGSSIPPPPCEEGKCIFLAIQTSIRLIQTVGSLSHVGLVECMFPPLLNSSQHVLAHFWGCDTMIEALLPAYESLVTTSLTIQVSKGSGDDAVAASTKTAEDIHLLRRQSISSLCKFLIPPSQSTEFILTDSHVKTMVSLFSLIHEHANMFEEEDWSVILETLEQVSYMVVLSPRMSDDSCDTAIALSSSLSLLTEFSLSLSDTSLFRFASSMANLKGIDIPSLAGTVSGGGGANFVGIGAQSGFGGANNSVTSDNTLSSRLMNIASKTMQRLGVEGDRESGHQHGKGKMHPIRHFGDDLRHRAFARNGGESSGASHKKPDFVLSLGFPFVCLMDLGRVNVRRGYIITGLVAGYLKEVAMNHKSAEVRAFAVDELARLIVVELGGTTGNVGINRFTPKKAREAAGVEHIFRTSDLLAGSPSAAASSGSPSFKLRNNIEKVEPLMIAITQSKFEDVTEAGLFALHGMLENVGQSLKEAWPHVIGTLTKCAEKNLAFKCLRLIVDDFLETMREVEVVSLVGCCSSFGASRVDVNRSLTAIGMLWTVSDYVSKISEKSPADTCQNMWRILFSKLIELSLDVRPEIRNCAVNTLFSCVAANGAKFAATDEWPFVFSDVIFTVLKSIVANLKGASEDTFEVRGNSQITVHHSRDNPKKQWAQTFKISLEGLCRVLRQYMDQIKLRPWFLPIWENVCKLGLSCLSFDESEVAIAGVHLLLLSVELSSKHGIGGGSVRAGVNMQVVNGSLQQVTKSFSNFEVEEEEEERGGVQYQAASELVMSAPTSEQTAQQALVFRVAFQSLEKIPTYEDSPNKEDTLSALADGLEHVYDCCKKFELTNTATSSNKESWVLDRFVDIMQHLVNESGTVASGLASPKKLKYATSAQKSVLNQLRNLSFNGSSYAFEVLVKLGGVAFAKRSRACALDLEAARIIAEAFGFEHINDETKVIELPKILACFEHWIEESVVEDGTQLSAVNDSVGATSDVVYSRDASLVEFGELLLLVLRGGLSALEETEKIRLETLKLSNAVSSDSESVVVTDTSERADRIWKGALSTTFSFLSPSICRTRVQTPPTQGSPPLKSSQRLTVAGTDDEAAASAWNSMIDTSLMILSCIITSAPLTVWPGLAEMLVDSAVNSYAATKWHAGAGRVGQAAAEVRIVKACIAALIESVSEKGEFVEGIRALGRIGNTVLEGVAKGAKVLASRKRHSSAQCGEHTAGRQLFASPIATDSATTARLKTLTERRSAIERAVEKNGGSFGLDDDDDGEDDDEDDDHSTGDAGEQEMKSDRLVRAHEFEIVCALIVCEEVLKGVINFVEKIKRIMFSDMCSSLIKVVGVVDSQELRRVAAKVIDLADFPGFINRASEKEEELAKRIDELEREVKSLRASQFLGF